MKCVAFNIIDDLVQFANDNTTISLLAVGKEWIKLTHCRHISQRKNCLFNFIHKLLTNTFPKIS